MTLSSCLVASGAHHTFQKKSEDMSFSNTSIVSEYSWPSSQDSLLSKPSILLGGFYIPVQGLQSIQHGHLLVQANPVLSNTRRITQQSQRNNLIQACCKASTSKLPKQNNNTNILALWQHWLSGNNLFIARQTSSLAGNFAWASGGFEKVGIQRFGSPEMCGSPCACHVRGLQWKSITLNATQLTFYTATWQSDSICRNSLLVFFF